MDVRVKRERKKMRIEIEKDGKIIGRVMRMGDEWKVMLDDRELIEIGGEIMGSRENKFKEEIIGMIVRVREFEGRKEGMVDIDDEERNFMEKLVGEKMNIERKKKKLSVGILKDLNKMEIGLRIVGIGERDMMEGNIVVKKEILIVEMVWKKEKDIDGKREDIKEIEKIVEEMEEERKNKKSIEEMGIVIKIEINIERWGKWGKKIEKLIKKKEIIGNEDEENEKEKSIKIVELGDIDDVEKIEGKIKRNSGKDKEGGIESESKEKVKNKY